MTKKEMMMNHLLNQMPAYEEMLAVEAKKFSVSKLEVAIKLYEFCIHAHYLSYDRNEVRRANIVATNFVKSVKKIIAKKANNDVENVFNNLTKRVTSEVDDACHNAVQNTIRNKRFIQFEAMNLAYICAHSNRLADVMYVVDSMFRVKINKLDVMSLCNTNFVFSSRSNDNNITQIQVI